VSRGDVFFGRSGALAEEEFFHVLDDDLLILAAGGVEAVLVEEHLAEFGPLIPGLLGDVVVDFLAERVVEGRLGESGELLLEFCAEDGSLCHRYFPGKLSHMGWVRVRAVSSGIRRARCWGMWTALCGDRIGAVVCVNEGVRR